jgi:excisionase family DNA binding protein
MTVRRPLNANDRHSPAEHDGSLASERDDVARGSGIARLGAPHAVSAHRRREPNRFVTVLDVAERLGVSERTIRRWIAAGILPVHRFGRAVRISEIDLAAFLALHRDY